VVLVDGREKERNNHLKDFKGNSIIEAREKCNFKEQIYDALCVILSC
jgi:hypothetical protein